MKIVNISLEMNNGFSVKYWQKLCTKLRKLNLKIALFSVFDAGTPPSDTPFFPLQWQKIYNSSGKGTKTEKAGGI